MSALGNRAAIFVGPEGPDSAWGAASVVAAGGVLASAAEAYGVVWTASRREVELAAVLADAHQAEWVHTAYSGVDAFAQLIDQSQWRWTTGKGLLARPVAEQALALMLASLHHLPELARSPRWIEPEPRTLFGARVLIVGAGGVGKALSGLLQPFSCAIDMLSRSDLQQPTRTGKPPLHEYLPPADIVVLAAPLTPQTDGLFGTDEFNLMSPKAIIVNVSRGRLIRTSDLVEALQGNQIYSAAIDVVDPEPLPPRHPLYSHPRCLLTCHTAVTETSGRGMLGARIAHNVSRFMRGETLMGIVDPVKGY